MKKFNLKSNMKVELTEFGYETIIRHYAGPDDDIEYAREVINNSTDENGYTTLSMRDLMTCFGGDFSGSHFGGGNKMPFETMEVLIDEKDLLDLENPSTAKSDKKFSIFYYALTSAILATIFMIAGLVSHDKTMTVGALCLFIISGVFFLMNIAMNEYKEYIDESIAKLR